MKPQESVQLLDYLRAVWERWQLIALVVAVSTGLALAVSLSSEKEYVATAQLLLRGVESITFLDPNQASRSNDPERDLNTEVQLIKIGRPTAELAQGRLGLKRSVDTLVSQIEVVPTNTTNIVQLRARDPSPALAAAIANAFAESYVKFRVNSARQRYREAAGLARQQLLALTPEDRRTDEGRALQARQRELEIAAALQTGGAELVQRATVPSSASRPRPKLSAVVGALLGLVLGIAAALALNLVDRRFKDEHGVEQFFGLPILAAIPRPARRTDAFDDPVQREAYGLLASNLGLASVDRASAVIITSPSPADGKTSVTLGLARAYARLGLRVVIVEADLRRPAFGRYTDVSRSVGVTGVLADGVLTDELLWLDAETLRPTEWRADAGGAIGLLPAGEPPANPQRTLSDPKMRLVIETARTSADVVLIDSAPLGTVNDAAVLAPLVDGVVLVARLNQTTKDAGRRAIRTLRSLGTDTLGVVITGTGGSDRHLYYSAAPPLAQTRPAEKAWSRGD